MPTQKYVSHARLTCQAVQGIARTLKTLEEHSGQSRESFARQIGVTPLTYRRLVAGKANPMILLLHSITCRLGITLKQLLGFQLLDLVGLGEAKRVRMLFVRQRNESRAGIGSARRLRR